MEHENQLNHLPTPPSDFDRATQLLRGTGQDLASLKEDITPHMTDRELRFCRNHYAERKRVPYRGELRLWDRVLSLRHKETEGILIESMGCEDGYIAETYQDLLTKLRVWEPHRSEPPTLLACASVSGGYLHMIGRSAAYRPPFADRFTASSPFSYSAFVLLFPKEEGQSDYQTALESLSQREEIAALSFKRIPVSEYGLLATLSLHAKGLIGNPDLLPLREGENLFTALNDAYTGLELWNLSRDAATAVCDLAEEHGLYAVHFARATDGEDFLMQSTQRGAPRKIINLSILRELMTLSYPVAAWIREEDPQEQVPAHKITEEICEVFSDSLPSARLLCVGGERTVTANGYSQSLSLCVDLLLWLICRGVNRRAIALDLCYTLPCASQSEDDRGKLLAPMLGAYRATMELATPQPSPRLFFQGEQTHLSFVSYASVPSSLIPNEGAKEGDLLYYLPVWHEGQADFGAIRNAADRFHALAEAGRIHSARPVFGDLAYAVKELLGTSELEQTETPSHSVGKRGILFTAQETLELPCLGKIRGNWSPKTEEMTDAEEFGSDAP